MRDLRPLRKHLPQQLDLQKESDCVTVTGEIQSWLAGLCNRRAQVARSIFPVDANNDRISSCFENGHPRHELQIRLFGIARRRCPQMGRYVAATDARGENDFFRAGTATDSSATVCVCRTRCRALLLFLSPGAIMVSFSKRKGKVCLLVGRSGHEQRLRTLPASSAKSRGALGCERVVLTSASDRGQNRISPFASTCRRRANHNIVIVGSDENYNKSRTKQSHISRYQRGWSLGIIATRI